MKRGLNVKSEKFERNCNSIPTSFAVLGSWYMKKLLGIIVLGLLLSGCVTTIEPTSQTNNPAKSASTIKIIYSDTNEIYIMAKGGMMTTPIFKKPKPNYFKTAFNHCSSYKKNTYILHKKANPLPYKFTFDPDYAAAYSSSGKDLYDWRQFIHGRTGNKNNLYEAYRFVCANTKNEALNIRPFPERYHGYSEEIRMSHRGTLTAIEQKRFVSSEEIAQNAQKAKERKIKEAKIKEAKRKNFMASLDKLYGKECMGGAFKKKLEKGTVDFNNCLLDKDNDAKLKAKVERELLEKKNTELEKKQTELNKKLAAMPPTERHAYNCTEVFNFKKGTEKFNDCVFKLYTAELDLQKLELEKKVAEAQIKAAANSQAMAEAVANAQIASAKASRRSSDLNNSIKMMKMGSDMLSGSSSKSSSNSSSNDRLRTTCRNVGGFLVCN